MEKMPYEKISRRDRLRPELAFVAIVDTGSEHNESQDWHSRALCRGMDGDIFFPKRGGSANEARKICAQCDVSAECLEEQLALSNNDDKGGVWAGTTERERRNLRKERRQDSSISHL